MKKRKILVVDDEIHMLKLLDTLITESTPFQATTTNNSLEIPEILSREHFSVVVTDLRMPGLDGLDILRWIKDNGHSEEVIIMTAFGSSATASEALELGAYDYLTKPFHREQIVFTLMSAVRYHDLRKESERISKVFESGSLDEARQAFEKEYFFRTAVRCGWDVAAVASAAGVSEAEAAAHLEELK
jgi:DNA-binding NtrC family response regulator